MVPARNNTKHLSSVSHTTKTIHHHHHYHRYLPTVSAQLSDAAHCNINKNVTFFPSPFHAHCPKMVRHILTMLKRILQDFYSVTEHFGKLCIKGNI